MLGHIVEMNHTIETKLCTDSYHTGTNMMEMNGDNLCRNRLEYSLAYRHHRSEYTCPSMTDHSGRESMSWLRNRDHNCTCMWEHRMSKMLHNSLAFRSPYIARMSKKSDAMGHRCNRFSLNRSLHTVIQVLTHPSELEHDGAG